MSIQSTLRSRFFDKARRDILMNPLDPLSHSWNLWQELEGQPALIDELAASFIPENEANPDTFWITSARSVLSASLTYLIENHQTIYHDLHEMLLTIPLKELYRRLQSTAAASLVDPQMDKTALGIRATLASYVSCLSSLTENPKSLFFLQFGSQEISSKPWLFLSCQTDEREYIKPLFSAWMALTIKGVMRRHLSSSRQPPARTWIIIDELASLHKLPTLLTGLSEIRKYGGCFVLGFQDLSQIESIYGHHPTKML